jgi:predicted AAA+ superfamily ATPase
MDGVPGIVPRQALATLRERVDAFRVVVVNGPRQAGKTTLLRVLEAERGGTYASLDDPELQRVAVTDPMAFAQYGDRPLIIDEVQRGGDPLVLSVKRVVDDSPVAGQFVLSGSTRFLTVPTLSESLAGRAVFVDLWPFAVAERVGVAGSFLERLFGDAGSLVGQASGWRREDYLRVVCAGGYPEAVRLGQARNRSIWYRGYLNTVISRDIQQFADIQRRHVLPQLLELVAGRSGTPLVVADLAGSLGVSAATVRNYLSYLDTVFLVSQARPWSSNLTHRVTRSPKAFVTDSGLAAHLLGVDHQALLRPGHPVTGGLFETFVYSELVKLASFADSDVEICHYRDRDGREIDFVLQTRDGRVAALEVKSSLSPRTDDARHLRWLAAKLGDRFVAGVVLHMGQVNLPFGDRIYAMPASTLWDHARLPAVP